MTMLATVYCTDEDILAWAPGDFATLVPAAQQIAGGSDGVVASGSRTLTSTSSNFTASAVADGHVVLLYKSAAPAETPTDILVVNSVSSSHVLSLRRPGMVAGEGAPPATSLQSTPFAIRTFWPQIENASFEINRRLGIDPALSAWTPDDLADQRDLRQVTVYAVLAFSYRGQCRQPDDLYAAKAKQFQAERDELLARLVVRWNASRTSQPPTTRFGTRLSR
jgi:hypothetical protein